MAFRTRRREKQLYECGLVKLPAVESKDEELRVIGAGHGERSPTSGIPPVRIVDYGDQKGQITAR